MFFFFYIGLKKIGLKLKAQRRESPLPCYTCNQLPQVRATKATSPLHETLCRQEATSGALATADVDY